MALSTAVKWYTSAMPGASVITPAAGNAITILDACLVNGFGSTAVTSLIVVGAVATVTFGASHTFPAFCVVEIAGATPAGLNGEKRVLSVTDTTLTFDAAAITDQTATGTITCALPAGGWEKPFSDTTIAVYKSLDVESSGFYFRVLDAQISTFVVTGYEAMSGHSTGTDPFGAASFMKASNTVTSPARPWLVITDGRFVYWCPTAYIGSNSYGALMLGFGDIVPTWTADPYAVIVRGSATEATTAGAAPSAAMSLLLASTTLVANLTLARDAAGTLKDADAITHPGPMVISVIADAAGGTTKAMSYPGGKDYRVFLLQMNVFDGNNNLAMRGAVPGLLAFGHDMRGPLLQPLPLPRQIFDVPTESARKYMNVAVQVTTSTYANSLVDVIGPWR